MHGSDTVRERFQYLRSSNGVIVLAMSQWRAKRLRRTQKEAILPSEFMHMVAAMTVAARKPLLVMREKSVSERGAFRRGYLHPVIDIPSSLDPTWCRSEIFGREFMKWKDTVDNFHHVFLGYSSQAEPVGKLIKQVLTERMGIKVFDWHKFVRGDSVWDSIGTAECMTSAGIFLFMADDSIGSGRTRQQVPRDNVIYEAGVFAGAKDQRHVLIIREEGARIPSDLGGILLLNLTSRTDISDIADALVEAVTRMLDTPISLANPERHQL